MGNEKSDKPTNRIELAVFDLDGTLVDSIADIAAATNRVLRAANRPIHPLAAYRDYVGSGVTELLRCAAPNATEREIKTLEREFRADYTERLLEQTVLFPGIDTALKRLAAESVELAILSNKPHAMTVKITKALLPKHRFSHVLGQRGGVAKKPDPIALFDIIESTGAAAARTVMVGDTPIDIETAKRASCHGIGVSWGFRPADELRQKGAAVVVCSAAELADRILTIT